MTKRLFSSAGLVAVLAAVMTVPLAGTRSTFVPDWTFKGSTLTGWQVVGDASWQATNGELVGTPKSPAGGWLMLDKGFQICSSALTSSARPAARPACSCAPKRLRLA